MLPNSLNLIYRRHRHPFARRLFTRGQHAFLHVVLRKRNGLLQPPQWEWTRESSRYGLQRSAFYAAHDGSTARVVAWRRWRRSLCFRRTFASFHRRLRAALYCTCHDVCYVLRAGDVSQSASMQLGSSCWTPNVDAYFMCCTSRLNCWVICAS